MSAPTVPSPDAPRAARLAAPLLLVAAVALTYGNVVRAPFLPDDATAIVRNPDVRSLATSWRAVADQRRTSVSGRPLASATLALNHAAGGTSVVGYRVVNVALHACAAVLLWSVLAATLRSAGANALTAVLQALGVALVWALHPLASQAVNYVVQRTEILAALFTLAAVRLSIAGARTSAPRLWSPAVVAAALLGVASKETAAAAPLIVLAHDALFLSGSWSLALRRRPLLYAGLAGSWVVLALLVAAGPRATAVGFDLGISPWSYLLTQAQVVTHYLRLALWPSPLVISYQDWPIAHSLAEVWPEAALVAGLALATAVLVRRGAGIALAGVVFFLVLAPSSSFVPIVTEVAAEHRMYLPLAGVILLAACGAQRAVRAVARGARLERWEGGALAGLAAAAAVALAVATHARNDDYRSAVTLWSDAVAKRPANPVAHAALGFALEQEGDLRRALAEYEAAIRIDPDSRDGWCNAGFPLQRLGLAEEAQRAFATCAALESRVAHARAAGR